MHLALPLVLICVCFDMKGRRRGSYSERRLWREPDSKESKARLCGVRSIFKRNTERHKSKGKGAGSEGNKVEQTERRSPSLLGQIRSDGEAGGPQCSQTKDGLDGGPGAAEGRLPLSVVQLHKGILGNRWRETRRRLIGLLEKMCLPAFVLCCICRCSQTALLKHHNDSDWQVHHCSRGHNTSNSTYELCSFRHKDLRDFINHLAPLVLLNKCGLRTYGTHQCICS